MQNNCSENRLSNLKDKEKNRKREKYKADRQRNIC